MNDLNSLRPEVREALACMDSCATVKPSSGDGFLDETWLTIRAELVRLADECAELHKAAARGALAHMKTQAELGALKARIAEAPVATLVYGQSDMLSVLSAENADDWAGRLVRLVVEE